jgi:hypothetical protein
MVLRRGSVGTWVTGGSGVSDNVTLLIPLSGIRGLRGAISKAAEVGEIEGKLPVVGQKVAR